MSRPHGSLVCAGVLWIEGLGERAAVSPALDLGCPCRRPRGGTAPARTTAHAIGMRKHMRTAVFLRCCGVPGGRGPGCGGARRKPLPHAGETCESHEASAFRGKGRKRRAAVPGTVLQELNRGHGALGLRGAWDSPARFPGGTRRGVLRGVGDRTGTSQEGCCCKVKIPFSPDFS